MSKTGAIKAGVYNRLDAESPNTPFLTWAIIAYYRKLRDAFISQMKDLCLSFICTKIH